MQLLPLEYLYQMMEQANGKLDVFVYRNDIKIHDVCTIIEWSCFLRKHLSDEMSLTSRKYKVGIAASLDISTENCFHIFLWIIANLLKLIYRNNTFLSACSKQANISSKV